MEDDGQTYRIEIVAGVEALDNQDDNVDVFVWFGNGERYSATFFTVANIKSILGRYEETGECAGGTYFWASNMVVVRDLTISTIHSAIKDLLQTGEFYSIFAGPFHNETAEHSREIS